MNIQCLTVYSAFYEQFHFGFTTYLGKGGVEIIIPILWKKKPRLRIAKWFSETTWLVSRELKINFRSCLFSLHLSSSSEESLTFLEVVKHFSYFPPLLLMLLRRGKKTATTFMHLSDAQQAMCESTSTPTHSISIYLHPSCRGAGFRGLHTSNMES